MVIRYKGCSLSGDSHLSNVSKGNYLEQTQLSGIYRGERNRLPQMPKAELVECTGALSDTVAVSQNSLVFQISSDAGQTTSLALRNMHTSNLGV